MLLHLKSHDQQIHHHRQSLIIVDPPDLAMEMIVEPIPATSSQTPVISDAEEDVENFFMIFIHNWMQPFKLCWILLSQY
jgi:hypothetical protein